jgi:hypothetical protein
MCLNKHFHLLSELLEPKLSYLLNNVLKFYIRLDLHDSQGDNLMVDALKTDCSKYAQLILNSQSYHPPQLNHLNERSGNLLSLAVTQKKLDIALELL